MTNSQWLSSRLTELGILPVEHATVPDDLRATTAAILRLAAAADLVISTGGLGPTADDLTRAALAAAMGQDLVEDADALAQVQGRFVGRPMPAINRLQAQRPARASILPNPTGTAPGLRGTVEVGGREVEVFCLPGPPREMRPMFASAVAPLLRPVRFIRTKSLLTFGHGESEIATRLGDLMDRRRNPTVGTTASHGIVSCRIRYESPDASSASAATADLAIADTAAIIESKLGPYIFGQDSDTLPSVILSLLKPRGQTLATVESCTGGLLGAMITETPGSSAVYRGGWVTYTNELKQQQVGVPAAIFSATGPGAVSRECADVMARGGLERSGADHCLTITGIAGPDGGSQEKPVGTVWIALASRAGLVLSRRFLFPGERVNIRDWSARSALAMLRFALIGQPDLPLMRQQAP
jgi:nicotinamide-nucleotide amidase